MFPIATCRELIKARYRIQIRWSGACYSAPVRFPALILNSLHAANAMAVLAPATAAEGAAAAGWLDTTAAMDGYAIAGPGPWRMVGPCWPARPGWTETLPHSRQQHTIAGSVGVHPSAGRGRAPDSVRSMAVSPPTPSHAEWFRLRPVRPSDGRSDRRAAAALHAGLRIDPDELAATLLIISGATASADTTAWT